MSSTDQRDDKDLVKRAQAGDRDAFSDLIRRHQASLHGIASRILIVHEEVFDLVQDTFIRAWTNLDKFDSERPFGPWVRTICRNLITNFIRDKRVERTRAQAIVDSALMHTPTLEEILGDGGSDQRERMAALQLCLEKLAPSQRELLSRRYDRDLTIPEIGTEMGRSVGGVAMALSRVRAALGRCVEAQLAPDEK